jgi:hypothetical protein
MTTNKLFAVAYTDFFTNTTTISFVKAKSKFGAATLFLFSEKQIGIESFDDCEDFEDIYDRVLDWDALIEVAEVPCG